MPVRTTGHTGLARNGTRHTHRHRLTPAAHRHPRATSRRRATATRRMQPRPHRARAVNCELMAQLKGSILARRDDTASPVLEPHLLGTISFQSVQDLRKCGELGFPSYRRDIALKEVIGDGTAEFRSGVQGGRGPDRPGRRASRSRRWRGSWGSTKAPWVGG